MLHSSGEGYTVIYTYYYPYTRGHGVCYTIVTFPYWGFPPERLPRTLIEVTPIGVKLLPDYVQLVQGIPDIFCRCLPGCCLIDIPCIIHKAMHNSTGSLNGHHLVILPALLHFIPWNRQGWESLGIMLGGLYLNQCKKLIHFWMHRYFPRRLSGDWSHHKGQIALNGFRHLLHLLTREANCLLVSGDGCPTFAQVYLDPIDRAPQDKLGIRLHS